MDWNAGCSDEPGGAWSARPSPAIRWRGEGGDGARRVVELSGDVADGAEGWKSRCLGQDAISLQIRHEQELVRNRGRRNGSARSPDATGRGPSAGNSATSRAPW